MVHAYGLDRPGGAQQSLRYHLDHAPPHVRVDVVLPEDPTALGDYDAVVLGNLRPMGGLGEQAEAAWAIQWAARLRDYHGLSIRSERDIHPCIHRDGRCVVGSPPRRQACACPPLIRQSFADLYNACSAVQFLSPLHRQVITAIIDVRVRQFVIASPIDFDHFRSRVPWEEREPSALIIGDAIRVAPTAPQRASAAGFAPVFVPCLTVPYAQMPALYNRYRAVVVDPVMWHAFGRVAVEALACGCRVLAGERVGAMSWPDPIEASKRANDEFWRMVCGRWTFPASAPEKPGAALPMGKLNV
jgi:hypothetical protein